MNYKMISKAFHKGNVISKNQNLEIEIVSKLRHKIIIYQKSIQLKQSS